MLSPWFFLGLQVLRHVAAGLQVLCAALGGCGKSMEFLYRYPGDVLNVEAPFFLLEIT